jgi:hypothetical protein
MGWDGRFIAFPDHPGNFTIFDALHAKNKKRMVDFGGGRRPVFYDERLQKAHHIHFPCFKDQHRLLQHYYGAAMMTICFSFLIFYCMVIDSIILYGSLSVKYCCYGDRWLLILTLYSKVLLLICCWLCCLYVQALLSL